MSEKIIPFSRAKELQNKKNKQGDSWLVSFIWLICSSCKTSQYTFLEAAAGRKHNRCGAQVAELNIKINPIEQFKIARYNQKIAYTLLAEKRKIAELANDSSLEVRDIWQASIVFISKLQEAHPADYDDISIVAKDEIVELAQKLKYSSDRNGIIFSPYLNPPNE